MYWYFVVVVVFVVGGGIFFFFFPRYYVKEHGFTNDEKQSLISVSFSHLLTVSNDYMTVFPLICDVMTLVCK
jgi:hypothetical protein